MAEAAKAAAKRKEEAPSALRRLGELLSELLPPELQETQSSGAEDSKALLPSLSFEMFDALAEHVDVPGLKNCVGLPADSSTKGYAMSCYRIFCC